MIDFRVKVTCSLAKGYTADDAEISEDSLGEHIYGIQAICADEAREAGLDRYHDQNAIGVLDHVDIDTEVISPLEGVCETCGHTAEDHEADNGETRCWKGSGNGNTCSCKEFAPKVEGIRRRLQLQRRADGWWYQCWHDSGEGAALVADWQFGAETRDLAVFCAQRRFGEDYEDVKDIRSALEALG